MTAKKSAHVTSDALVTSDAEEETDDDDGKCNALLIIHTLTFVHHV